MLMGIAETINKASEIENPEERIEFLRKAIKHGVPLKSFYDMLYEPPRFMVKEIRVKGYETPSDVDEFTLFNFLKFLKNLKYESVENQRKGLEYVFSIVSDDDRELLIRTIVNGKGPSRRVSKKTLEKAIANV